MNQKKSCKLKHLIDSNVLPIGMGLISPTWLGSTLRLSKRTSGYWEIPERELLSMLYPKCFVPSSSHQDQPSVSKAERSRSSQVTPAWRGEVSPQPPADVPKPSKGSERQAHLPLLPERWKILPVPECVTICQGSVWCLPSRVRNRGDVKKGSHMVAWTLLMHESGLREGDWGEGSTGWTLRVLS